MLATRHQSDRRPSLVRRPSGARSSGCCWQTSLPLVWIAGENWHRPGHARRMHDFYCTVMMKLLSALLVTVAFADRAPTTVEDKYLETIKVDDNVYVFKPKIDWSHGNGVAILAPEGVFFIDTYLQFNYAEEAIRRLKQITKLPVKYVFNTHSHNDHTTGNGVFRRIYPESRLIVNEAAVVGLEGRVKTKVEGEKAFIDGELAQADTEVKLGKTRGNTPLVGSMKAFWELSLREAREYRQQYRPEKYVRPDIVFGDTLKQYVPRHRRRQGDGACFGSVGALLLGNSDAVAPASTVTVCLVDPASVCTTTVCSPGVRSSTVTGDGPIGTPSTLILPPAGSVRTCGAAVGDRTFAHLDVLG